MIRFRSIVPGVVAVAFALWSASARAGGILLPGDGPQSQARGGAFVAKADDPSALYANPAGFMKQRGTVIELGSNFINMALSFQRGGSYEKTSEGYSYEGQPYPKVSDQSNPPIGIAGFQAIPILAASTDLGHPEWRLRIGGGVFVPNGYPLRNFDPKYQFQAQGVAPPPQRYDVMKQSAAAVLPSLAVAYRVTSWLDVGARVSWGLAQISAKDYLWGLENYDEDVAKDSVFTVKAKDNFVPAAGVGVTVRPSRSIEIGAAWNSALNINAKGTGETQLGSQLVYPGTTNPIMINPITTNYRCAPGGTAAALKACLDFAIPQTVALGGRWIWRDGGGGERADVEADVKWENWSANRATNYLVVVDGQTLLGPLYPQVIRHDFRDVISTRLGGSYAIPLARNKLILRAGGAYDTAAAPDAYSRVDVDGAARTTLAGGLAYETGRYRVAAGGGVVLEPARNAPATCQTTTMMPSCDGASSPPDPSVRKQPDPIQPVQSQDNQFQSPFNGGRYTSSYVVLSAGFTMWF